MGATLDTILKAIAASREALEAKIDAVVTGGYREGQSNKAHTEDLNPEMTTIQGRLTAMENRLHTSKTAIRVTLHKFVLYREDFLG
ncbi:hypothetical protein NDU88_005947 [Pleurodeles waltl]|uniref:Uncharacterized protein n=1 Tax=Pleurodeles waltl TaxID=8319 RepID=A0AAV7SN41_PLEWA|nr:hypothetical protein NDU88_005947 [Pleurodeles waltl]